MRQFKLSLLFLFFVLFGSTFFKVPTLSAQNSVNTIWGIQYGGLSAGAKGSYIMPLRDFGKMLKYGYGSIIDVFIEDLFVCNLDLGIEGGYWRFSGENDRVDSMYMIPICIRARYRYSIFNSVSIVPGLSGGYSYNSVKYDGNDLVYVTKYKEKSSFEPLVVGGLSLYYRIMKELSIQIGAEYGAIIESDGIMDFISANLAVRVYF